MPSLATASTPPTQGQRATREGRGGARRSRSHELSWRIVLDGPRGGATNMSLDHALAACLADDDGEGVVRLYGWSEPTVSFGKNEPAASVGPDLAYVRRPTGGRAVLHDHELTYAVIAPVDAFGGLREAYVTINRALADAIGALGAEVSVAGDEGTIAGATAPLDAGACFEMPARGEIVAAGRKLVGSAQARIGGTFLQHGSILLAGDQRRLGASGSDVVSPEGPRPQAESSNPVTLTELLGEVSPEAVRAAVRAAFGDRFGGEWTEATYRPDELEAADRLVTERYGLDTWTWRK